MSPPLEVPAGFGSFPASSVPDDRGSFGGGAGGNGIRPAYGSSRSYNPPSSSSRHGSFGLGGSGSTDGLAAMPTVKPGRKISPPLPPPPPTTA
ncbi:hypothetical protein BTJ68_03282 [Hortaea werneckii EXF-2000]|uniref:Uncharacterized protein n=1 Tax=Hortaea werneckii EXF-2000 TaxID=1157616 RepID=A0A1Z5TL21_HORWE|nr:hypothetical protein BTJ68_03282 [Hortaea werneckii EXF-2000]